LAKTVLRRRFCYVAIGVFCLLVIGIFASWFVAGQLVAPRQQEIGLSPADLPATSISLESESGATIAGWHIPADDSKGVIVLLHGIRGSRLSMLERARLLNAAGYSIVMIDLQGHGESLGEQITIGHLEKHDARAAVEFARKQHPNEPIGVIGVSLGGASALLASPLGIDALVIESVYPDIESAVNNRVAARLGPLSDIPAWLLLMQLEPRLGIETSQLRPIDHVSIVGCPVFVISGTEDLHTTAAETRRFYEAANEPKELWLVDGAAHVDLLSKAPTEYRSRVTSFLSEHLRSRIPIASQQ
jgi:alpha-beta hydrolase superfamily lysophospholipase